jgi:hypothetical protein
LFTAAENKIYWVTVVVVVVVVVWAPHLRLWSPSGMAIKTPYIRLWSFVH